MDSTEDRTDLAVLFKGAGASSPDEEGRVTHRQSQGLCGSVRSWPHWGLDPFERKPEPALDDRELNKGRFPSRTLIP